MIFEVAKPLFQSFFPGLMAFIFLTAFIIADRTFPVATIRITTAALFSAFIVLCADSVNYYFQDLHSHETLRLIMLAISFSGKIGCSGLTVALSQRAKSKSRACLYLLIAFNAVVSIVSIFTGCVFYIAPDYSVGHGFLYFIPYLCIVINCIILFKNAIEQISTNPGETIIIIAIILWSFFATYLEVIFHLRLMLPITFLLSVVFYFMCLNVHLYRRDTLTNLLNRRSFYIDARRHSKRSMIILSMDLNNLKNYNDTMGHKAGDQAICKSVECMLLAFKNLGVVYRTGGDEFMALFVDKESATICDAIVKFQKSLADTPYRVACGVSEYKPGDDFESIASDSEQKMYRNKMIMKAEKN